MKILFSILFVLFYNLAAGQFYKVSDKNISFTSSIAELIVNTIDGSDFKLSINGDQFKMYESGEHIYYSFSQSINFVEIKFDPSDSNIVHSINLIRNSKLNIDSIQYLSVLDSLQVQSNNSCSGNISMLPDGISYLSLSGGAGSIHGSIDSLPTNIVTLSVAQANTITGSIDSLPASLSNLYLLGSNTVHGDVSLLSPNIISITLTGLNSITGNIKHFSSSTYHVEISGNNSCFGSIDSISPGITYFSISGSHANLTGSIDSIPGTVVSFIISCPNNVTGTLDNINPQLVTFIVTGNNTTTGNVALLPSSISWYLNFGNNTAIEYTPGRNWGTMRAFQTTSAFTSESVDSLLIDLSNSNWILQKIVSITGSAAPRTSASDAAVATLISKGVTVTTNNP